jgi:predicted membrane protein
MSNNIEQPNKTPQGKVVAGAILLIVGGLLLIKQFNYFFFPSWIFSWPMWLIVWGVYTGAKHNWRKPLWFILVILGVGFLLDNETSFDVGGIMWPVIIIAFGLYIIIKKNRSADAANGTADYWDAKYKATPFASEKAPIDFNDPAYTASSSADVPPVEPINNTPPTEDDYLNATAIFGGVNKSVFSKNFRGGDITNIFGGTELDFTQANINGRVVIDITQVFGGTKIIVPANWHVISDMAAVFAGVDDKRIKTAQSTSTDKILVLRGTSLFAGIDIRSY